VQAFTLLFDSQPLPPTLALQKGVSTSCARSPQADGGQQHPQGKDSTHRPSHVAARLKFPQIVRVHLLLGHHRGAIGRSRQPLSDLPTQFPANLAARLVSKRKGAVC
jgi:hypothetical protein